MGCGCRGSPGTWIAAGFGMPLAGLQEAVVETTPCSPQRDAVRCIRCRLQNPPTDSGEEAFYDWAAAIMYLRSQVALLRNQTGRCMSR